MSVELRHLRSFVAVAEELNFTRAAARVHLAQQALSAQIRQLEDLVGARLFARTTRKVELTAAGRALLERLPTLLEGIEHALNAAVQAGRGETGELRVGLLATAPLEFTPRLLRAFAEARPRVAVSIRSYPFDDPSGGLREHRTDVALVWLPFNSEGLVCEPLFADPRMAVLAADHPLAARSELEARDLVDEPIVWIDDMDPVARDFWTLADHRPGRPPRIGARVTGFEDLFAAVRAGQAIAAWPDLCGARAAVRGPGRPAGSRHCARTSGGLPSRRRRDRGRRGLRADGDHAARCRWPEVPAAGLCPTRPDAPTAAVTRRR